MVAASLPWALRHSVMSATQWIEIHQLTLSIPRTTLLDDSLDDGVATEQEFEVEELLVYFDEALAAR
jgi:hypothetical protein